MISRFRPSLGFTLSALLLSQSFAATPSDGRPLRLAVRIVRSNPVATIIVGDQQVEAVVDTGGGVIALSESVIKRAGGTKVPDENVGTDIYGTKNRVPQFRIPTINIGGQVFRDIVVAQAQEWSGGEGPPVPNSIGREFISRYFTIIDYAGRSITFWPADFSDSANTDCGTLRVPMEDTEESNLAVGTFSTQAGPFRLLWDTGATYSMLPETIARDRHLKTTTQGQTAFYKTAALSAAGRNNLGPLEFVILPLKLPPDFEGMLGANFMSEHVVCLDYQKREVRVR
jgi:hypothetical protein